ncbi:MAG: ABC transporter substrate-binding protein, partial [Reyranella sp.]
MRRRKFIADTAALLVSPWASRAQGTPHRLGVLGQGSGLDSALKDGLRNRGWIDGQNLIVETRHAPSQDHLPALAAELVALSPDLLIGGGPQAAAALKSATATIPIVFVAVADPVGIGLVQSLARPGGNITGLSTSVPGFARKEVDLLREIVPSASKIAVLVNPTNPMHRLTVANDHPEIIQQLGVALPVVEATVAEELDSAFASAAAQKSDAIKVTGDALIFHHAAHVIALAAKHRLPAIYFTRYFVANGGLLSYGPQLADLFFRAGGYADKIL